MPRTDLLLLLLIVAATFLMPERIARSLRNLWRSYGRLAGHPIAMVCLSGALAFAGNLAFSLLVRFPQPYIVDEFSYLFGAETFLAGRLTTPTHPFHAHFRDIHNIESPTWQSKYPPGQSLLLSIGGLVGQPIIGAWLGMALAISGLCWMLFGLLPGRWALTGTLIGLLNWWLMLRWGQSYLGAAGAMLGGTLTLGAFVRLWRDPRPRYGILMALGLFLLAISRPFEGLVTCLPFTCLLLKRILTASGPDRRRLLVCGLLPCVLTLSTAFVWLGYYHARVTGSAFVMPYQAWTQQKSRQPLGNLLSGVNKLLPDSRHADRTLLQRIRYVTTRGVNRIQPTVLICFPPLLMVTLLTLPLLRRQPWTRFLIATACTTWTAGFLIQSLWIPPEYLAPIIGVNVFLMTQGLRGLYVLRLGTNRYGSRFAMLLVASTMAAFLIHWLRTEKAGALPPQVRERARIMAELLQSPGKDLVFLRYRHGADAESQRLSRGDNQQTVWCHNSPDVDQSEIVWALELNSPSDQKLVKYFRDRRVWIAEPDGENLLLRSVDPQR